MKKIITHKKYRFAAIGGAVFLLVMAAAVVGWYRPQKNAVASAQTVASGVVPQVGLDIGDYGDCSHNYNEGGVPNTGPENNMPGNNFWTPVGGGDSGYIGVYYHAPGSGYGQGDCIQAGFQSQNKGLLNEDFRVGIRSEIYGDGDCAVSKFGDWQYTPWASAGGGDSPMTTRVSGTNGSTCFQVRVQTSTLPVGTVINQSSINFSVNAGTSGGFVGSASAASNCYFTYYNPGAGGPPSETCMMTHVANGGGWFNTIGVSLSGVSSEGAQEAANNIPTTFSPNETKTAGGDGNPLSITMKNTGSVSWYSTFTSKDAGVPSGTCNYSYGNSGVNDAPASGSQSGAQCTVPVLLTSQNYFLVHASSSFSISPEEIPITYNAIKTTTYTPAHMGTIKANCFQDGPDEYDQQCPLPDGSSCSGSDETCSGSEQVPESWTVSYSGGGYASAIASGQSVTFPISSIAAPSAPSSYNETWQMQGNGTSFGAPFTLPITVGGASAAGTINVVSKNATTSAPVNSSWRVTAGMLPNMDACAFDSTSALCSGTSAAYKNIPVGGDPVGVSPNATSAGPLYALRGVEEQSNIALKKNNGLVGDLFALSRNLLAGVADAATVCSYVGTPGQPCPSADLNVPAQTLVNSGDIANFTILWDPIAAMTVTPPTLALDSSNAPIGNVTITNSGAPGSVLNWMANTTSTWLSLSSGSGSITNSASGNATQSLKLTASPSGLSDGTYSATVNFSGHPADLLSDIFSSPLTVTYTVGSGSGNPCPDCVTPSSTPTISITPAVSTIPLGSSEQLTIDSTSATTCAQTGDWSGSACSGAVTVTPNATGTLTYIDTATNVNGTAQASATVTVTGASGSTSTSTPPSPSSPFCAVQASPSSVTPGSASTLSFNCVNITPASCLMYVASGPVQTEFTFPANDMSGSTLSGTVSEKPTANTLYTVDCGNGVTASATVTVTNPGLQETNPQ